LPVGAIRLLKVIANALSAGLGFARRKVSDYLSDNVILTTSGHFHTRTLLNASSTSDLSHPPCAHWWSGTPW
jgi:hypothetical protein